MQAIDLKIIILCAPAISALVAILIILFDTLEEKRTQRRLKLKLILYLGCVIASLSSMLIYFINPSLLVWLNGLFMLCFMLIPVFLYAFIFKITSTDQPEHFSYYHYLAPTALALLLIIVSIFTPYEEQINVFKGDGASIGKSSLFFYLSNGKLFFRLIFSIVYIILSFRRLSPYRKYISNYSANESKSALRWIPIYLFFTIGLIPIPLVGLFTSRIGLAGSLITFVHIALMMIQHSFLAFHVVKGNYILQEPSVIREEETEQNVLKKNKENELSSETLLKKTALKKKQFEAYINTQKPYLKSELKITDLVNDLQINRTYISTFINREYGMNFSAFINQKRSEEYKLLRAKSKLSNKSNSELAESAGFGSYRSYRRFVAQKEE